MILKTAKPADDSPQESLLKEIEAEYTKATETLAEVTLMLEQSQSELAKLTQRNANTTAHLQQVQAQFETMPRMDIKMAYNAALDTQQRMLVMRGQLDRLQRDEEELQKKIVLLEKVRELLGVGVKPQPNSPRAIGGNRPASLEMVINAQEAERQRLSRQMHDGPAQALSNFIVQTEIVARLLDIDQGRAKEEMNSLKTAAMNTFKEVRTFIFELRPMMLDDLGLIPTIKRYIESFKEQTGVEINFSMKGSERRLQPFLEVMIFRALQELVGNAYRHNEDLPSKVQITVGVMLDESSIKLVVSDTGKGFNLDGGERTDHLGLNLIRERVEMLGGHMEIDSGLGRGARVSFQVPILDADN